MKQICILTAGTLPVPPVRGGAVENLIDMILRENESACSAKFTVASIYDEEAARNVSEYRQTEFHFVEIPKAIRILDGIVHACAKVVFEQKAHSFRCIFARLFYIKNATKFLRENDFDRVVAENHHSLFLVMKDRLVSRKYAQTFFYHAHNVPGGSFTCKKQIERCRNILTVSDFISACYRQSYPRCAAEFRVVKNGIDTELFSQKLTEAERTAFRKSLGIGSDDFLLFFAGRLNAEKGIDRLCEAFVRLSIPNVKLMICGANFFGTDSKSPFEVRLLGILGEKCRDVVFTGFVPYREIWRFYAVCDVAVLPSIVDEAALLTNIEASVASLPVITTSSGGIPEYSNLPSAILLERDDNLVWNICMQCESLYGNHSLRKQLGELNHDFAVQFSKERFYRDFMAALGIVDA